MSQQIMHCKVAKLALLYRSARVPNEWWMANRLVQRCSDSAQGFCVFLPSSNYNSQVSSPRKSDPTSTFHPAKIDHGPSGRLHAGRKPRSVARRGPARAT